MTPPSPPQGAEGAYREAHAACGGDRTENGSATCDWPNEHGCDHEDLHAALDACIRAVLAERGHILGCYCTVGEEILKSYDDPRCARPAWLPEVEP